jgi:hypothetical protein
MSTGYRLLNVTAGEQISFLHVAAATKREIAGNPAAAAIVAWYLLEHPGHEIAFVSDTNGERPFRTMPASRADELVDVTDAVVRALIEQGILQDVGALFVDEHDPERVYVRDLRNVWNP